MSYEISKRQRKVTINKVFWGVVVILDVLAIVGLIAIHRWCQYSPSRTHESVLCVGNPDNICEFNPDGSLDKNPQPSNPDRPTYDGAGNEYDSAGHLMKSAPQVKSIFSPALPEFAGK